MKKLLLLALFCLLGACGRNAAVNTPDELDEPDKVLYDRAMHEMERNRYTVARLALQTLINTYPDSEFLPQAKYGLAESFYREGGTSMLNQSEVEFRDYITFFPATDLADDAQLMVALTHVRQMEKPDRDPTQARAAEAELKKMISAYPDSPLLDEAKQRLRDVQEILAEGIFKVGHQYLLRRSYPAASSRYREILEKYPDYSKMDETLYSLAESLRRNNNPPESAIYYARIVSDHPQSEFVEDAKEHLTELKMPIPEVNPVAIARAQQRPEGKGLFGKVIGVFGRRPEVATETGAARVGPEPEEQSSSGRDGDGSFTVNGRVVVDPSKPEVKPEVNPEVKPELKPEVKPECKPDDKLENRPECKPEDKK